MEIKERKINILESVLNNVSLVNESVLVYNMKGLCDKLYRYRWKMSVNVSEFDFISISLL